MCYDRDCSKKYSERNGRNSKNTAVRLEWMQRISEKGNENLGQLGYTDHSQKHCMQVAHQAEYGALLANELLKETDMTLEDRVTIVPRFCSYCSCKTGRRNVAVACLAILFALGFVFLKIADRQPMAGER